MSGTLAQILSEEDQHRLASIRAKHAAFSALTDTRTWESTFFLSIIDRMNDLELMR